MRAITRHLLAAALLLQGVSAWACPICQGWGKPSAAQRLVATPQLAVLLGKPTPGDRVLDGEQQSRTLRGLVEEGVGARRQAGLRGKLVTVAGEDHHRDLDGPLAEVLKQAEPVHARHLEIEQDGVGALTIDCVKSREGIRRFGDLEPGAAEHCAGREPVGGVVVNDKNTACELHAVSVPQAGNGPGRAAAA